MRMFFGFFVKGTVQDARRITGMKNIRAQDDSRHRQNMMSGPYQHFIGQASNVFAVSFITKETTTQLTEDPSPIQGAQRTQSRNTRFQFTPPRGREHLPQPPEMTPDNALTARADGGIATGIQPVHQEIQPPVITHEGIGMHDQEKGRLDVGHRAVERLKMSGPGVIRNARWHEFNPFNRSQIIN